MLDNGTKTRINNARDILVGKVPDPKAQVEQITTALIYKFMHDMDQESVVLGGKPSFFVEEFAQYRWSQLMDKRLGGHERLDLYVQAITRMGQNPHIPQLFRDIFKDAFLPYRDPETLNLFLKEINGFSYDHSERLGDAFEYLLSILGSQGAAGQFRTPRHIIDFIVQAVAPTKNDTILDPACGTAGFLISAYKYILDKNSLPVNGEGGHRPGGVLTPDERQRLTRNFVGYDISPDMVRLSLVNMYLHQFQQPTITEYDTLTSEEHWDDTFDVILANPPFMSPKGGIRPHQRFSIQSKRSEVLFVDYIAEHLNSNGRAGVIVPEGIIFQSSNAYKALRKKLVDEHYLWAVVSLPAGVFNPYSGVKTSILLLDKTLAKRADRILFVDVQNDGFGLGAQRRKIEQDDLPQALQLIQAYQADPSLEVDSHLAHAVPKEKIAEDGDYNLSGGRYREVIDYRKVKWPLAELGEVITLEYGKGLKKDDRKGGDYPVFGSNGIVGYHNEYLVEGPFIIVGRKGSAGEVTFSELSGFPIDTTFYIRIIDQNKLDLKYIYHQLKYLRLGEINIQAGIPGLNRNDAYRKKIPLPPLEVQRAIVAEIDSYQAVIDGARQVVENYSPRILIDPEWPVVELGEISENLDRRRVPITKSDRIPGNIPYYGASDIVDYVKDYIFDEDLLLISEDGANLRARVTPIAFSISGKAWVNNHAHVLRFNNLETQYFVEHYLNSISLDRYITGAAQPKINQKALSSIKIPLPPFEAQQSIIDLIQNEQTLVESNRQLIDIFQAKIDAAIARVWGEG